MNVKIQNLIGSLINFYQLTLTLIDHHTIIDTFIIFAWNGNIKILYYFNKSLRYKLNKIYVIN